MFLKNVNTKVDVQSETSSQKIVTTQYLPMTPWSYDLAYVEERFQITNDGEVTTETLESKVMIFEKAAPFMIVEQRMKRGKVDKNGRIHHVDWEYKETPTPYTVIISEVESIDNFQRFLEESVIKFITSV